jgi:hypothetical protein
MGNIRVEPIPAKLKLEMGTPVIKMRTELYMHMHAIAKEHRDNAKTIASADINNINDEIKESMISILFSYTCLEAYINTIGKDRLGKDWTKYSSDSTEAKWMVVSNTLATRKYVKKHSIFSNNKDPFKSFRDLETIREDYIIHRKAEFDDVVSTKYGKTVGTINTLNWEKADWACNTVKNMIELLCKNIDKPPSIDWLNTPL